MSGICKRCGSDVMVMDDTGLCTSCEKQLEQIALMQARAVENAKKDAEQLGIWCNDYNKFIQNEILREDYNIRLGSPFDYFKNVGANFNKFKLFFLFIQMLRYFLPYFC